MLDFLFPKRRAATDSDGAWSGRSGSFGLRMRTNAGVEVNESLALCYAAVWCATRILSETVATLPLGLYRRQDDDNRQAVTDDPRLSLLKLSPNPTMGAMAFREGRVAHQANWGQGFAEIVPNARGEPVELWPVHPARVRPARPGDRADGYDYLVRNNDGSQTALRASEMLHIPGCLSEDGIWGKGVIAYARESVGIGIATERHGATTFGSGNLPRGIVHGAQMRDPQQRANFRTEWKQIHGSPDSGEIAILPLDAKFTQVTMSNEDSQFLQTRKHNVTEIGRWYRLPPHMLGDLERATFSNIESQGMEFVIYSLYPWCRRWEEQLAIKLLRPEERGALYWEHNFAGLLRGDITSRMNAYRVAIGTGVMTLNECRKLENLPGIGPAGDQHYVPLNMTTAEAMAKSPPLPGAAGRGPGSDQSGAPQDQQASEDWVRGLTRLARQELVAQLRGMEGDARNGRGE